ncbi:MAG: tetratricopeptide repeat protein [candidate division Zixibacteria bacterium]|nr:tetratricopeptide repeat protein [Candidatus Tariuqbacter arcticus]
MKRILPWLMVVFLLGCAAEYELIEEEPEAVGPEWTPAQVDSIIRYNRMFFFDYYNQMSRKNDFTAEGCERSLFYFWNYIDFDAERKYNDFPQAARCYIEWGKFIPEKSDSSRMVFEMGVELFPDSDYLHNALGIIYKNRNDLATAEEHFLAASEIDPTKTDYLIPLTEIYQLEMEWDKARETCEKVLKIDPNNTVIRDRRETILRDHFSTEEYIAALKEKIELEPDNLDNWLNLAQQHMNLGNNQEAKKAVDETLKRDPNLIAALTLLGAVKQNLQDYSGAIESYKKILDAMPNDVIVLLDIASCYKNLQKYSSARTYIMKALNAEPGNGTAYFKLGEVYEAAADLASRGKQATYSDKLTFTIAYGLFVKAANSDDYTARDNASRKVKYLDNNLILPQKSDWFMHQDEFVPTGDAYKWIKANWDEVKYPKKYLKRYSG